MYLQKAEGGMVSVPCEFEGLVNIEIIEKNEDSMVVRIIKPEILFEMEKKTKRRGRKKKKANTGKEGRKAEEKNENREKSEGKYSKREVEEIIKNSYGKLTFEELAEETGKTVEEIKDLAKAMLAKGEIENSVDEEFIFRLYNEEGITNAKEIKDYIENRFVKVNLNALRIMEMVRRAISVRHALHCRECPELRQGADGAWCPVRKYRVKPEQFICLERVKELVGE